MYISHMRYEGTRLLEAIDELIEIAKESGAPAEIYHFKQAGKANWGKLDAVIAKVECGARRRASGSPPTCTPIPPARPGLDAAMPTWVQTGGLEAWIERLKDPATRAKADRRRCRTPQSDWENLSCSPAEPDKVLLIGVQESEAEAADRQDSRRGCRDARQEPRGNRDGPRHRGRQPRRHGLFPDERGQCPKRRSACRG